MNTSSIGLTSDELYQVTHYRYAKKLKWTPSVTQ